MLNPQDIVRRRNIREQRRYNQGNSTNVQPSRCTLSGAVTTQLYAQRSSQSKNAKHEPDEV
jgi:hypothetical protein